MKKSLSFRDFLENNIELFGFIKNVCCHCDFFRNFKALIAFNEVNQCDFGGTYGELLSDAVSWSSTKTHKSERVDLVALTLPSLRPKSKRIFEVLFAVMISSRLSSYYCPFRNRNILHIIIALGNSEKHSISNIK